jgi:predicted nucleotidyltransferase
MSIEEIKSQILPVLKKYGVKRAGIFGSVARKVFRQPDMHS